MDEKKKMTHAEDPNQEPMHHDMPASHEMHGHEMHGHEMHDHEMHHHDMQMDHDMPMDHEMPGHEMHEHKMPGGMPMPTDHAGHEAHTDHTGHERMFRRKFWVSLILSIPV